MNDFDTKWQKLTTLARHAPAEPAGEVPAGFAARVTLQAASFSLPSPWAVLEHLALRGLVAATACCVAAVAFNYFGASPDMTDEADFDATMSVLLDLS